jgi:outer membrane receptor protein involved in Fe transport
MLDPICLSRVPNVSLSLVLMATLGQVAVAEEPEAPEAPAAEALQEITVTAQKREQSIQSVGTSITALDGAALGKRGLSDVTSLASQTPGMQFNPADKGFSSLRAPIKRVNIANVAIPYAPAAEAAVVPDAHKIGAAVLSILRH